MTVPKAIRRRRRRRREEEEEEEEEKEEEKKQHLARVDDYSRSSLRDASAK